MTPSKLGSEGRFSRAAVVVMMVLLLGIAWLAPFRHVILRYVSDDAFYYLEIARRIGMGQGTTWDGITRTNGYHPLWQVLFVPLTPVINASREAGVRLVMSLSILLLGAALLLIDRVTARLAPRGAPLALLFTASSFAFSTILGMESALSALLLAWVLWQISDRAALRNIGKSALLGLASGLLFLSRLDSLAYVIALDALLLLLLLRSGRDIASRTDWRPAAACAVIQLVIIAGYFGYNHFEFGHFLTVSALIKTDRRSGLTLDGVKSVLGCLGVVSLLLGGVALRTRRFDADSLPLYVSVAGTALSLGVTVATGGPESRNWYFMLPVLCGCLHLAVVVEPLLRRSPLKHLVGAGVVSASLLIIAVSLYGKFSTRSPSYGMTCAIQEKFDRAEWAYRFSPPDTVLMEPDCGILGYISRRSVLNGDGLTSSFGFRDALYQNRLPQWLERHHLNSIILPAQTAPLQNCRGHYLIALKTYPKKWGRTAASRWADQPDLYAVISPVTLPGSDPRYRLWRVLSVAPGVPSQVDGCTRAAAK